MAKSPLVEGTFVMRWRDEEGQNRFVVEATWVEVKARFERVVDALCPDEDLERLRAEYSMIEEVSIVSSPPRPVGLFGCLKTPSDEPQVLVVASGRFPILGSRSMGVQRRIDALPRDVQLERYAPQDLAAFE